MNCITRTGNIVTAIKVCLWDRCEQKLCPVQWMLEYRRKAKKESK